jgi:hypothetical protein
MRALKALRVQPPRAQVLALLQEVWRLKQPLLVESRPQESQA